MNTMMFPTKILQQFLTSELCYQTPSNCFFFQNWDISEFEMRPYHPKVIIKSPYQISRNDWRFHKQMIGMLFKARRVDTTIQMQLQCWYSLACC